MSAVLPRCGDGKPPGYNQCDLNVDVYTCLSVCDQGLGFGVWLNYDKEDVIEGDVSVSIYELGEYSRKFLRFENFHPTRKFSIISVL